MLRPTDYNRSELDVEQESAYLFWTIVQAVRDYVFFKIKASHSSYEHYEFAKSWITNPQFVAQWGDSDDPPCFTFGEALEMMGVHPENVNVFRDMISEAHRANTPEERSQLVRNAYGELHFHEHNEPNPYAWIGRSPGFLTSLRIDEVF